MNTNQAPMHYYKFNEDGEPIRSDFHFDEDSGEKRMTSFDEWWGDDPKHGEITAREAWQAAQEAERERILKIVEQVGIQGNHNEWFDCCDTIVERIKNG